MKIIQVNKSAGFEYFIEDSFEAGISLEGGEVKSIRAGNVSLKDSYCSIYQGSVYIKNLHITVYDKSGAYNTHEARRDRLLLLHRSEIRKIKEKVAEKGYTLVPLKLYFNKSLIKVELGLCRGKHTYDKKNVIADRDRQRSMEREIKNYKF